ncbi:MAG: hypothetical protein WBK91_06855 [Alphaproteobacteria bacterium]
MSKKRAQLLLRPWLANPDNRLAHAFVFLCSGILVLHHRKNPILQEQLFALELMELYDVGQRAVFFFGQQIIKVRMPFA